MPNSVITYSKDGKGIGGLNRSGATQIPDYDFDVVRNFRRDASKRLITRRGIVIFGDDPDSKPCTSYFYHKRDDGGGKIALRVSGTRMYKYTEATNVWTEIVAGLTEFETGTTKKTRWSFAVYKNVIICCDGVNNVKTITIPGGVVTDQAALPKVRYLKYSADRICGFGEDANPNSFYYSDAAPVAATNFADNTVVVGGDEQGIGSGLKEIGNLVLAAKTKKIYVMNFATPSAQPLNAREGLYSSRAWLHTGNGTLMFNNEGISTLTVRGDFEGGQALEREVDSQKVNDLLKDILPVSYNSNAGFVLDNIDYDQYFFAYDSNGDDVPDKTIVRSTFTGDYFEYTTPAGYDYGVYEMNDGEVKYIVASAISGQMYELESGFNDAGLAIDYELYTKKWDFSAPEVWKDGDRFSIFGLKNKKSEIEVMVYLDDTLAVSATIDDTRIDITGGSQPIGVKPIGTLPIGKGVSTVDLFPYGIHIPLLAYGGFSRIQVRIRAFAQNTVFTLDKIAINWSGNTFDLLDYNKIA